MEETPPPTLNVYAALREYAEEYHRALGIKNLIVTTQRSILYAAPELAELGITPAEIKKIRDRNAAKFESNTHSAFANLERFRNPDGSSSEEILRIVTLDSAFKDGGYFPPGSPEAINAIAVFDHEMGHAIVKEGDPLKSSRHMAEVAAEAFTTLRHIQRFGMTTDIFSWAPTQNAGIIIFGSKNHYTPAAFQKIEKLSREMDISKLSLEETSQLAGKIAREYNTELALDKIHNAFLPVRKYWQEHADDFPGVLKEITKVMLEHKDDHDIYRAGKLYLENPNVKTFVAQGLSQEDPFWKDAGARMEKHEKESGFILNAADAIDAKRPAPKPRAASPQGPKA